MSDADERSHAGQTQEAEGDLISGRVVAGHAHRGEGRADRDAPDAPSSSGSPARGRARSARRRGSTRSASTRASSSRRSGSRRTGSTRTASSALTNAAARRDATTGSRSTTIPSRDARAARSAACAHTKQPTAEQLADADVLLTAAYAALGEDLLVGQVEPEDRRHRAGTSTPKDENVDSALVRTLTKMPLDKSIAAMRPPDDGVRGAPEGAGALSATSSRRAAGRRCPAGKALKRGQSDSPSASRRCARDCRRKGSTSARAAPSRIPTGDHDERAAHRRRRATGGACSTRRSPRAVAQFQARHGITVDSTLGTETLDALNVPAEYRLGQIAANLERYRWMPRTLGAALHLRERARVPAHRVRQRRDARSR